MSDIKKEVVEQFMHLQMLLHRYQIHNFMSFGPWGSPHRGQGRVLAILKMKPEISQKELTYLLNMSKQSLAELLNKLEKNGYIKRETSEEDRRSFNVKLTEAGAAIAGEMDDTPPDLKILFDCLNEEELAKFNEYLKRIIERFEEQFSGDEEDIRMKLMKKFMEHKGRHFREFRHMFGRGPFPGFFGSGCGRDWDSPHHEEDED